MQMEQPTPAAPGKSSGLQQGQSLRLAPQVFNVGGLFDAAPGTFEVDVESADTDNTLAYGLLAKISAVNTANAFNQQVAGRPNFVRMNIISRTNAVDFAGWITG